MVVHHGGHLMADIHVEPVLGQVEEFQLDLVSVQLTDEGKNIVLR